MRAAVYENFQGKITIQNVPDPRPKKGGVILKVLATGLCRSDWHGWMGHDSDIQLPHVPGHELAGEIVELGKDVKKFKKGDRVTVPFVCGCGACQPCKEGQQQVCDNQSQPGFTHWGSFAQYVALDYADTNLVMLPDSINDVTAAALGCRFITSFRAICYQGQVTEGQEVVIFGCGGVGLSAVMIAKALGANVTAIDINNDNLKIARSLGSKTLNNSTTDNLIEAIYDITGGGAHVSLDALGSEETSISSIHSLRKRGKHIQVGLMTGDHSHIKVPMDKVLAHELEIIGSHGMQAHKYDEMLKMIVEGQLAPEKLIHKTINLKDATTALPQMNSFKHQGMMVVNSFD